ncbi:type I-C CRISPR-associated protein Cas8c/Csd1 [Saccharibacillus qingshengii]|uniref:type I-C CRISPR-associated protein Cas8c/Csd1 n=1 Tax=Saccharibacillus qingshengii TaxID=1763540 RepID=UPI001555620C|nr:type I-C CRISPR-associated protein Cas8c/Csd1 [Saccharibacillus qingshengii]
MSLLLNLYKTYEANDQQVGQMMTKNNGREYTLLPIAHTTQNAHIEVTLTPDGTFHSAEVVEKEHADTLIPCTEESSSRAGSKIAPYPLHDKLSYVAGDFVAYGGQIKKEEPFAAYIRDLGKWADSPDAHAKVKSIYTYLRQRRLIEDLVKAKVLFLDENQQLIGKWDKKYEALHGEKPRIFSVLAGEQESALVRFNIYSPHGLLEKVWRDKEMYDSFIRYYSRQLGEEDYCYVTGRKLPATERHANKIRNSGDKAKLISSNDTSGFTFRGRFVQSGDAASIGYDVSQKAHNALKWLINRQSKIIDNRVFLVWTYQDLSVPDPMDDGYSLSQLGYSSDAEDHDADDHVESEATPTAELERTGDTGGDLAREVYKRIAGYRGDLDWSEDQIHILILDSATTGRMAVLYYRSMNKEQYFDRLLEWHTSCAWLHQYRKNDQGERVVFYGAPAPRDIALAAYGSKAGDKVIKGVMERMLPCIVDGGKVPQDIVRSVMNRASNPVSMDRWEWDKTLSIACALINQREGYALGLDKENEDRSYLFGRLLALADVLERNALGKEEKRSTNAIRYMNAFSRHPERTWQTIQAALQPHQARLGKEALYYSIQIDEVASRIPIEQFNNKPLTGKYLLGFYSQRHDLYQKRDKSGTQNLADSELHSNSVHEGENHE